MLCVCAEQPEQSLRVLTEWLMAWQICIRRQTGIGSLVDRSWLSFDRNFYRQLPSVALFHLCRNTFPFLFRGLIFPLC